MSRRLILRAWAVLIVMLLGVCLLGGLGSLGLVGPDEPRYVSIAQSMARTGDFITPRLWGHPWFEKPVLYYWSAAASFRLFGVNDWAARLPDALAALLGALLLGWAALRLYGNSAARLTLLLFPTTLGLFAFAHAATPDMLLTVSLEAAMVAALVALGFAAGLPAKRKVGQETVGGVVKSLQLPESGPAGAVVSRRISFLLVGFFLGIGTLAKGPVAVILAGGSVVAWAAATRRWRDAIRFLRWEAITAYAIVTVPWYVACSLANPGFAYDFLWHQNVQRFLTPVFEHVQPWWFFVPVLAMGLLPWTLVLLATLREGRRVFQQRAAALSPGVFVASWAAFPLLFFSFSKSKLPGYILPAIPPLVLLLARTIRGLPGRCSKSPTGTDRLGTAATALGGVTLIVLALAASRFLHRLPAGWLVAHQGAVHGLLLLTAAAGVISAAVAVWGLPRLAIAIPALWMGILIATLNWAFLPQLDPYLSARDAARAGARMAQGAPVEIYGISRDWQYGLNHYFDRELPKWSAAEAGPVWIYTTPKSLPIIRASRSIEFTLPLPSGLLLVRAGPTHR